MNCVVSSAESISKTPPSLYIHVPFCAHHCDYCAFYSEVATPAMLARYLKCLKTEIQWRAANLSPFTLFFGGGTPSILNIAQWLELKTSMDQGQVALPSEWTVECNPATLTKAKARCLRDIGVTRVSLGVQSLDDTLLERLGRSHNRRKVFTSYDDLRHVGFDNLNLDLMFAIPGQTLDGWIHTLREALAMNSEHLSVYEVTYEEDTPLFAQLKAGYTQVNEDLACDMYNAWLQLAGEAGYHQYEISNCARTQYATVDLLPSYACKHNVNYWKGGYYIGLGPSAASYLNQVRTHNWADVEHYCRDIENGREPIASEDRLSPVARAGEIAAFGLRMTAGWSFAEFQRVTGFDLRREWAREMEELIQRDYARHDGLRFWLTPAGQRYADWVAERLIRIDES